MNLAMLEETNLFLRNYNAKDRIYSNGDQLGQQFVDHITIRDWKKITKGRIILIFQD
jgi:hypothetical protein